MLKSTSVLADMSVLWLKGNRLQCAFDVVSQVFTISRLSFQGGRPDGAERRGGRMHLYEWEPQRSF